MNSPWWCGRSRRGRAGDLRLRDSENTVTRVEARTGEAVRMDKEEGIGRDFNRRTNRI